MIANVRESRRGESKCSMVNLAPSSHQFTANHRRSRPLHGSQLRISGYPLQPTLFATKRVMVSFTIPCRAENNIGIATIAVDHSATLTARAFVGVREEGFVGFGHAAGEAPRANALAWLCEQSDPSRSNSARWCLRRHWRGQTTSYAANSVPPPRWAPLLRRRPRR